MRWFTTCQLNRNYKEKLKVEGIPNSKILKKNFKNAFMALTWFPIESPYGKVLFWIFVLNIETALASIQVHRFPVACIKFPCVHIVQHLIEAKVQDQSYTSPQQKSENDSQALKGVPSPSNLMRKCTKMTMINNKVNGCLVKWRRCLWLLVSNAVTCTTCYGHDLHNISQKGSVPPAHHEMQTEYRFFSIARIAHLYF